MSKSISKNFIIYLSREGIFSVARGRFLQLSLLWGTGFFLFFFQLPGLFAEESNISLEEQNTILIEGKKSESRFDRTSPGKTLRLRPDSLPGYQVNNMLGQQSSLFIPDTGKNPASKFVIPRVRGHDTRYTEVYVNQVLLQDPYTGLTLNDDIDIREFGELMLYQGWVDSQLGAMSPFGVVQFLPYFSGKAKTTLGIDLGKPYGMSYWGLAQQKFQNSSLKSSTRIFALSHLTDGKYSYYDDHSTPYNESDDQILWRTNNDQRSHKISVLNKTEVNAFEVQTLFRHQQKLNGVASPNDQIHSLVRENSRLNQGDVNVTHPLLLPFADFFGLNLGFRDYQIDAFDPDADLLGTKNTQLISSSAYLQLQSGIAAEYFKTLCFAQATPVNVEISSSSIPSQKFSRLSNQYHCGMTIFPVDNFQLQLKGQLSTHDDKVRNGQDSFVDKTSKWRAWGLGFFTKSQWLRFFSHYLWKEQSPSLVALLGNGASIKANPLLTGETLRHMEAGIEVGEKEKNNISGSVSIFRDYTLNKIVFVPTNIMSNKAINYGDYVTSGIETNFDTQLGPLEYSGNYTRLWPKNLSQDSYSKIPGMPLEQGAQQLTHQWRRHKTYLTSLYRGKLYKDASALIAVAPVTTYNLGYHYRQPIDAGEIEFLFEVRNLLNTMRQKINAENTNQSQGYQSYAQVDGNPLPGRHYYLSLAFSF